MSGIKITDKELGMVERALSTEWQTTSALMGATDMDRDTLVKCLNELFRRHFARKKKQRREWSQWCNKDYLWCLKVKDAR